jgi:Catalase-related immune-responsive
MRAPLLLAEAAEIRRTAYLAHRDDSDFIQPGTLYRQVMSETDRDHLVANIVGHLSQGAERSIQQRAVNDYLKYVDQDLAARVAHWSWPIPPGEQLISFNRSGCSRASKLPRRLAFRYFASSCRRLTLAPDGANEQPDRDVHGNFEEPMNGGYPCRLGRRYEHDDG